MAVSKNTLVALLATALAGVHAAPLEPPTKVVDRAATPPATFTANPAIGTGGSSFTDSPHFRVYSTDTSGANKALAMLEATYDCYIGGLGWRSTGLSYNDQTDSGPWTKVNVYSVATLANAAGVMHSDASTGMGWLEVVNTYLSTPGVTVHEFGHVMHYHQKTWVDQTRTGAWWETLANWVADTFQTSDLCAAARTNHSQPTATTSEFNPRKVIGDSYQVIVDGSADTGNYYEAWPFLTFLTNNPDNFTNLGSDTLRQMMLQYAKGSNETPLHTLARVAGSSTSVATIVGRYWARMAYVDIKHPQAQKVFLSARSGINYANVDSNGSGKYTVKSGRAPRYMGSNITPLKVTAGAAVSVNVTASAAFTATLAVRNTAANTVRYVDLPAGSGSTTVASGEEASLIVANTPATLILYDAFALTADVNTGLSYSFTLSGATI